MSHSGRILVVEDEPNARTALAELLQDEGFTVEVAADGLKALDVYASFAPHVVVTDLKMPNLDGVELLRKITAMEDPAPVVVMTAFGEVSSVVEAMRAGAADYLTKPLNVDELVVVLERVLEVQALAREARQLRQRVHPRVAPRNIIGDAPAMQRLFEVIEQVAPSTATVLITGESGTGKELVANAIHQRSPRVARPFVKLHCAALPESLLESELFGHEQGSDAIARKEGRIEIADGGTLFLDEVGAISPSTQTKLVRFLQDHELERIGGTQTVQVDVRVIAATNRNLLDEIGKGRFREDLYYGLNEVSLELPTLRERKNDIPALVDLFIGRYAKENGKTIEGCRPAALEMLVGYDWPGNVRELENAIEHAVVLATGPTIEVKHLPPSVKPVVMAGMPVIPGAKMEDLERYAILETLKATGGSTSRAAQMLGISTRTIQYRLHQYDTAPRIKVVRRSEAHAPAKP